MKKYILISMLLSSCIQVTAQKDKPASPQIVERIINKIEIYTKKDSSVTYDLTITKLEVALTRFSRGNSNYQKRVIKYTIRNTGTMYVKLADIVLQGYVGNTYNAEPDSMTPVCGDWASKTKFILSPGQTYDGQFICDYEPYWVGKTYYVLRVDDHNIIPETDETNNTKIIQLNFIKN